MGSWLVQRKVLGRLLNRQSVLFFGIEIAVKDNKKTVVEAGVRAVLLNCERKFGQEHRGVCMSDFTSDYNTEHAIEHLLSNWMPINNEVLSRIKQRLFEGLYDGEQDLLFEELKKDPALLLRIIRELTGDIQSSDMTKRRVIASKTMSFQRNSNLEDVLLKACLSDIRTIVNRIDVEQCAHKLEKTTYLQAVRFQETAIACSCAEELAYASQIDMELAYSATLLRQFTLGLIAWNYPHIYNKAIETLKPGQLLTKELEKVLGVSPCIIAQQFAERWNLSFDILAAVATKDERSSSSAFTSFVDSGKGRPLPLGKICSLADSLARLNFPEQYPADIKTLDRTLEQIFKPLDHKTLTVVYFKAHKYISEFAAVCSKGVNFGVPKELRQRIAHSEKLAKLLENNQHIKALPDELKQDIKQLYSKFHPERILKSNINKLVDEIIPKAGFSRGCIYMYEPSTEVLNPAILIGGVSNEKRKPRKVRSKVTKPDLITSSFMMKSPLRESVKSDSGEQAIAIAGALGNSSRVGVLYLESDKHTQLLESKEALTAYRAIRQCISDCFNLS